MSINTNELRIGNFLFADLYGEKPILVESICNINKEIFNSTTGEIPLSSLRPISLTEEWLLKFRFILYSTGSLCKSLNNDDSYLAIDLKYGNGVWLNINQEGIENSIKLLHIKNVHELQNLFFTLTGVELSVS